MEDLVRLHSSLSEALRSGRNLRYSLEPCASEKNIYGRITFMPEWKVLAERKRRGAGEPVDLGLSVMWSSRNVGAPRGDQPGYYVGWGDVTAQQYSSDENDYPVAQNISGSKYDIARSLYAETWRIPTTEEMTELMTQCQWIWTAINGVTGFQIVGKTGASIFLPAGGSRYGTEHEDAYYYGRYWCSNCDDDKYHRAFCLEFSQMGGQLVTMGRFMGMLIRPVFDKR